jgi:hypothetical protein
VDLGQLWGHLPSFFVNFPPPLHQLPPMLPPVAPGCQATPKDAIRHDLLILLGLAWMGGRSWILLEGELVALTGIEPVF